MAQDWTEMLHNPCILRGPRMKEEKIRIGPQVGGNATEPLHSRRSQNVGGENYNWPTGGRKCYITLCILGTKSELAAQALPFGGPTSGRKCYITPAFSGVPK